MEGEKERREVERVTRVERRRLRVREEDMFAGCGGFGWELGVMVLVGYW
jgi:hypothetical protein